MTARILIATTSLIGMLSLTYCQAGSKPVQQAPIAAPPDALRLATLPPPVPKATGTSVMVYIKLEIDKKYGVVAHLLGGKRDNTLKHVTHDPAKPWWDNPLIAYAESPLLSADAIAGADADAITGQGSSGNVTIKLTLIPHADVNIKTVPASEGIKGTLTATISASAEFYDGEWVEMVHEADRKITFTFDTCDPHRRMVEIGQETRSIPAFAVERFTRDHEKWEPRGNWPDEARSGDWRVVIYARESQFQIRSFNYVEGSAADLQD